MVRPPSPARARATSTPAPRAPPPPSQLPKAERYRRYIEEYPEDAGLLGIDDDEYWDSCGGGLGDETGDHDGSRGSRWEPPRSEEEEAMEEEEEVSDTDLVGPLGRPLGTQGCARGSLQALSFCKLDSAA